MSGWKVLFEENFWGSNGADDYEKPGMCTTEHRINEVIDWYGETWKLLSFYTCSEGLILDYCKKIDPKELQSFTDRFQAAGFDADQFDEELFERIQLDNPTAPHVDVRLMRNGKTLCSKGGSCVTYVPDCVVNQENDPIAPFCVAHYGLDTRYAWHFTRTHYLWDEGCAGDLSNLTAVFDEMEVTVPGESFRLTGETQKIPLTHAVSNAHFDLYIEGVEARELDQEIIKNMDQEMLCPTHYEVVLYHTDPELPENSFFLKARVHGDSPVLKETSEKAAASVSIIGGSSGPTSIFFAGKRKNGTLQSKSVCSPLFFKQTPVRDWYICYHFKRREEMIVPLNIDGI